MGIKALLAAPFARYVVARDVLPVRKNALALQDKAFANLLAKGANTAIGKHLRLSAVRNYEDFKAHVPLSDYEQLRPWFERVVQGESNVLWPGKPLYISKTSGTTSGTKYIPITPDSMPHHIASARAALCAYIAETGNTAFTEGNMIFLQGSPELNNVNGIPTGRLSGIVAHHVPAYLQKNRLPSYATNCIADWETKVDAIVKETRNRPMSLISGIPSWVQMYFERLVKVTGKPVGDLFPNFQVFVYGGVNFDPYRKRFEALVGRSVDSIETYPASEGFIAFQDTRNEPGLLLTAASGTFYEFVPAEEFFNENPTRLRLSEVQTGRNYAVILNSNAGLWGYSIGDTVKFTSLNPYRLVVTGRIKHYISAFGEHVIGEEVDRAVQDAVAVCGGEVEEFTVAPQVNPSEGLPYHEWVIAFTHLPSSLPEFASALDKSMRRQNIYYNDLITGAVLQPARITVVAPGAFNKYMASIGKLGGQNKVPRLANDRTMCEALYQWRTDFV